MRLEEVIKRPLLSEKVMEQKESQNIVAFEVDGRARTAIKKVLPFHPTEAQKRVLKEIAQDMQRPSPMRRLLQGAAGRACLSRR